MDRARPERVVEVSGLADTREGPDVLALWADYQVMTCTQETHDATKANADLFRTHKLIGYMDLGADDDGVETRLEHRNCRLCGSTLCLEVPA